MHQNADSTDDNQTVINYQDVIAGTQIFRTIIFTRSSYGKLTLHLVCLGSELNN